jgi:hypothetical protein
VKEWVTDTLPVIKKVDRDTRNARPRGRGRILAHATDAQHLGPEGDLPEDEVRLRPGEAVCYRGITPSGELHFEVHDGSVRSDGVALVQYLEQLLRQVDGHVVILRDELPRHRSAVVRDFAGEHGDRLTTFRLPPYCPDFNPVEWPWADMRWKG